MSGTDLEPTDELAGFLEDLCASGISGGISWSDRAWQAQIVDPASPLLTEAVFRSLGEAAEWLRARAIELHPDSEFANDYRQRAG